MTHQGEIYQFENVSVQPRPTQKKIPTWVAAIQTAESFEWAGENGHKLMVVPYLADYDKLRANIQLYKEAYEKAGHGQVQKDQIPLSPDATISARVDCIPVELLKLISPPNVFPLSFDVLMNISEGEVMFLTFSCSVSHNVNIISSCCDL